MGLIDGIRAKVASGALEFSQHAVDQAILRHISVQELREAIASGEVPENVICPTIRLKRGLSRRK
jgi:hypothetical protein